MFGEETSTLCQLQALLHRKILIENPDSWSILFNNILQRQKHLQKVEKSRHAKVFSTLTLTFSISNVVFKLPIILNNFTIIN